MQYKTIVLELLQQQPELYEELRSKRTLQATMNYYSKQFKTSHESWKEKLVQARPGSDESQIASEAMELALKELADILPPVSKTSGEGLSLDDAMVFIRRRMPPV